MSDVAIGGESVPSTDLRINRHAFKVILQNWRNGTVGAIETMKILDDLANVEEVKIVKPPAVAYPFHCPTCLLGFNDMISMNDHILCVHDNVFGLNFYCDLCDAEFGSEVELGAHLKTHVAPRRFGGGVGRMISVMPDASSEIVDVFSMPLIPPAPPLGPGIPAAPPLEIKENKETKVPVPVPLVSRVMNIFGRFGGGRLYGGADPLPPLPPPAYTPKADDGFLFNIVDTRTTKKIVKPIEEKKVASKKPAYEEDEDDDYEDEPPAEIDDIQTNSRGRHCCMMCKKRYLSEHLLGAHFLIAHGKYDRMLELDENIQKIGFPGFEILEYIGMIRREPNRKGAIGKVCNICQENYKNCKSDDEKEIELDYDSDSEVMYRKKKHELIKGVQDDTLLSFSTDLIAFKMTDFVKYPELVNIVNKFESLVRVPIFMSCCGKHLCAECLENTLSNSSLLSCPFCYLDHTKYDQDYIRIYEIGKINKKAWREWWMSGDRYIKILV
ncbi:MAG: procyclic acidic repetitive protein PARP [Hyperionvirus sp.]|uniref:Procyclic acidic repetitive protein PARP n=1 Tax=Hyperionvirus sp. TaxID=2487770 RepID=A0A3G5AGT5_9VIRU|nr:MAG: procyclic acidic repetitive protein PARP [Hyperionvirus sp.]